MSANATSRFESLFCGEGFPYASLGELDLPKFERLLYKCKRQSGICIHPEYFTAA